MKRAPTDAVINAYLAATEGDVASLRYDRHIWRSGEEHLALAVLEQAVKDLELAAFTVQKCCELQHTERISDEAMRWLFADHHDNHPFSVVNICAHFGWDVHDLRAEVLRLPLVQRAVAVIQQNAVRIRWTRAHTRRKWRP